jgi:replication-associated recombination protein RarA
MAKMLCCPRVAAGIHRETLHGGGTQPSAPGNLDVGTDNRRGSIPGVMGAVQVPIGFRAESEDDSNANRTITEFVGLEKPKKVLRKFAEAPFPNAAFLFVGPSGTGKTSMALALCEAINGELHHIPSQRCNVETVEEVTRQCWYVPKNNSLHVVLVDEADQMSKGAQLGFLSKLDGTAFPPQTVFIFTANSTELLADRFLSRCMVLPFSSHGMAKEAADLLARIWEQEAGTDVEQPNFLRMVQDSKNNIRDAVNSLQVELLAL